MHKSLTSLAAAAAYILMLEAPVVPVAAQSEARFPAESKEAITDQTAVDAFATAQARLAFSLIEKITTGNNAAAPFQSRCMPMATNRHVDATVSPAILAGRQGAPRRHRPPGFAPGAMLSQVVQRAMIEINEEGAEAAAATAVMSSRALGADDAIPMVVDKPFVYAVRDTVTGLILVAGYVGQPPKGKTA